MNLFFTPVLCMVLGKSLARPVPNSTTVSFIPEPTGRGTVGLLLSSLLTLSLCCYSAVHLNVSEMGFGERILRFIPIGFVAKASTALLSLFVPEFILQAAFGQWMKARKICTTLRQEARQHDVSSHSESQIEDSSRTSAEDIPLVSVGTRKRRPIADGTLQKWSDITMEMAFFVVMEGLFLDSPEFLDLPEPMRRKLFLDEKEFLALVEAGLIQPNIFNQKDIDDKNKSDALGKFLACAQALWMAINVMARKASGLPTTLLELHVLFHIVCTIAMYWFWWNKPLSIVQPLLLSIGKEGAVVVSQGLDFAEDPEFTSLIFLTRLKPAVEITLFPEDSPPRSPVPYERSDQEPQTADARPAELVVTEKHYSVRIAPGQSLKGVSPPEFLRERQDVFDRASKALRNERFRRVMETAGTVTRDGTMFSFLKPEKKEGPILQRAWHPKVQAVIGLLYGALHATAWYSHFPSNNEKWMWRYSCIVVAASIPVIIVADNTLHVVLEYSKKLDLMADSAQGFSEAGWGCSLLFVSLSQFPVLLCFISCILLYIAARCFIVVEAFISLRSLPVAVYETVRWSDFWPHF